MIPRARAFTAVWLTDAATRDRAPGLLCASNLDGGVCRLLLDHGGAKLGTPTLQHLALARALCIIEDDYVPTARLRARTGPSP